MRILHLADIHLDSPFAGRSERIRARLRQATREALGSAVDLALAEEVHAVVVAGDLFDSVRLSFETEQFLVAQLSRLDEAGIPTVYATGNHDPGTIRQARREIGWPDSVTVVGSGSPIRTPVRTREGEVVGWITAAGHANSHETRDLASDFPTPDGNLPEVAVLHTQVVGAREAEAHDPYAPAALDTLLAAGYDYWALGHVHLRQCLADLPAVHYPGNLQGRSPREQGPKGALVAEVNRGFAAQVEFRPLAPVRWETLLIQDPSEAASLDGLVRLVADRWRASRQADPDPDREWMVRVVVEGASPLWRELEVAEDRDHLARELAPALGALEVQLRVRGLHPPAANADAHRGREDVLGVALRLAHDIRTGKATLPGIEKELAGAPDRDHLPDYLAELLRGSQGALVSRLRSRED